MKIQFCFPVFVRVLSDFITSNGKFLTSCGMMSSHLYVTHRLISWPWITPYIQALFEKCPLCSLHPGLGNWRLFSLWYLNCRACQWDSCWERGQLNSGRLQWKAPCLDKNLEGCEIFAAVLCQRELDMRNILFWEGGIVSVGIQWVPKKKKYSFFISLILWRLYLQHPHGITWRPPAF